MHIACTLEVFLLIVSIPSQGFSHIKHKFGFCVSSISSTQAMAPNTAVNGTATNGSANGHGPVKGINATLQTYDGPSHSLGNRWENTIRPYSESDVKRLRGAFMEVA